MKYISSIVASVLVLLSFSCTNDIDVTNTTSSSEMVDVTVNLSGFDVTDEVFTRASDKDAAGAAVTRIALKVYDQSGVRKISIVQSKDSDPTTFGSAMSFRLNVGTYKFVAVAHTVTSTDALVASIKSPTEVSFGAGLVNNPTYLKVQDVTIAGNTTQSVTMDMGTRKNAAFTINITDATPADVKSLEMIVNPTATIYTDLYVNPSTGFATSAWQYKRIVALSETDDGTFTNHNIGLPIFLTAATQSLDVTVNALDADSKVLYTRSLSNVSFQQGHKTLATGTLFSPTTSTSFVWFFRKME